MKNLRLLGSYVRLKRKPQEKAYKETFLELPESLKFDSFECEVLDVGPGEVTPCGEREPMNIKPGDIVVVFQGVGEIVLDDQSFITDISACEARVHRS